MSENVGSPIVGREYVLAGYVIRVVDTTPFMIKILYPHNSTVATISKSYFRKVARHVKDSSKQDLQEERDINDLLKEAGLKE